MVPQVNKFERWFPMCFFMTHSPIVYDLRSHSPDVNPPVYSIYFPKNQFLNKYSPVYNIYNFRNQLLNIKSPVYNISDFGTNS